MRCLCAVATLGSVASYATAYALCGRKRCSAPTIACHLGLLPLGEAGRGYMQLVTPRVVAIAVRMLMTSWMTNLMVSFFIAVKG